ncbi:MAG: DUF4388 domain-containing protein [Candidatus Methylomirabilales bacterium]
MGLVGRLEDLALPDIFQILNLSKKTGKLTLTRREGSGMIIFKEGRIIYAASDSVRDTLGNILICQKHLTENSLMAALELQHRSPEGKRLGTILVEKGFITPELLEQAIRQQIEQVIFEFLTWKTGFFKFDIMDIATEDAIEVDAKDFLLDGGMDPEHLLLEGVRRLDEQEEAAKKGRPAAEVSPPPTPKPPAPEPAKPAPPPRPEQPIPTGPRRAHANLKALLKEVQSPSFTGEITLSIMRYAADVVTRGVLLVLRKDGISGLGQFGVELASGSPDQVVRSIKIPLNEDSLLKTVIDTKNAFQGEVPAGKWNRHLLDLLGGSTPKEAILIPMIVAGKVVVIFYGDDAGTGRPVGDVEGLEFLMAQASLAMEKSVLEKRLQSLEGKTS